MIKIDSAPEVLQGQFTLPASKSICNRALIIRELSGNSFNIENISESEDSQNLKRNLNSLKQDALAVQTVDVGPAGTNMRFLTALLSAMEGEYILKGSQRMHQRPVKVLVEALKSLGAEITYLENEGFPPLRIKPGRLRGGKIEIPSHVSSQFISSLMMIGPVLTEGLKLSLAGKTVSSSYIQMTREIMQACGAVVDWEKNGITIQPSGYSRKEDFLVEADWSAASYWYALATASKHSDILLKGLHQKSFQGDAVVRNWFKDFGIKTEWDGEGFRLMKQNQPKLTEFVQDFTNNPDLAQTMIPLLSLLKLTGKLTGLQTLRIKETDRIVAMQSEMAKFGVDLHFENEYLTVPPVWPKFSEKSVKTYKDHRMAMAMVILSYAFSPVKIEDETVVGKSYPRFWDDLQKAGFKMEKL